MRHVHLVLLSNFCSCRSNGKFQMRCVHVAFLCNFCNCRTNGKLQMCQVRVAVRSIVTMVSFEFLINKVIHLPFGQKKIHTHIYTNNSKLTIVTMDLTATRTRRICNLPLLLKVQKLHKNTTWTRRIYNLTLLLQEKKKQCKAYTPLTTNSILRVKNLCSHFLTAACAEFLMLYSGYVAAFIIADKSLSL